MRPAVTGRAKLITGDRFFRWLTLSRSAFPTLLIAFAVNPIVPNAELTASTFVTPGLLRHSRFSEQGFRPKRGAVRDSGYACRGAPPFSRFSRRHRFD